MKHNTQWAAVLAALCVAACVATSSSTSVSASPSVLSAGDALSSGQGITSGNGWLTMQPSGELAVCANVATDGTCSTTPLWTPPPMDGRLDVELVPGSYAFMAPYGCLEVSDREWISCSHANALHQNGHNSCQHSHPMDSHETFHALIHWQRGVSSDKGSAYHGNTYTHTCHDIYISLSHRITHHSRTYALKNSPLASCTCHTITFAPLRLHINRARTAILTHSHN
jgi:hypothetical protein